MTTSPQALARALLLAAEKATKGEWRVNQFNGIPNAVMAPHPDLGWMAVATLTVHHDIHANAAYIALANPVNLTALVTWALEMEARNAELEKALTDARTWHEAEDKALSKQPPSHGPNGNQWARLQHREQIDLLTAAIAGKQP